MNMKLLSIIAVSLVTATQVFAQGYIVPNGVTTVGVQPGLGIIIHVVQNPLNGDFTGFTLPPQDSTTFLFNPFLDEGVRTFLVSANDPISLQPILANNYPELTYPNTYTFANGTPFYLGFYTGATYPMNGVYSDPLFGWARLVNINGVIQLLDGALEYGGGGIYAGTQTIIPVPEPRVLALVTTGVLALACHMRRPRAEQVRQNR